MSFSEYDLKSREALARVSLVAEDPLSEIVATSLLFSITTRSGQGRQRVYDEYPHLVLHVLGSIGYHVYDSGAFWPRLKAQLAVHYQKHHESLTPTQHNYWPGGIEGELGQAFLDALNVTKKPSVSFAGARKYVAPILFHGGIPKGCAANFVTTIEQNLHYASDAESLIDRLLGAAQYQLLKPNLDFIIDGDRFAVSVVERTLEAILVHKTRGNLDSIDLNEDIKKAIRNLGKGGAPTGGASGRIAQPYLRLDPYSATIDLVLPALSDVPSSFSWTIQAAGESQSVFPRINFAGSGVESHAHRVEQPVISLNAGSADLDQSFTTQFIDPSSPTVFFDFNGRKESVRTELPAKTLWVLTPKEIADELKPHVQQSHPGPLGWTSWSLHLIDFTAASKAQIGDREFRVRQVQTPQLLGHLHPGGISMDGLPIYTSQLKITLPRDIELDVWRVTVRHERSNEILTVSATDQPTDFEVELKPEVAGVYEVQVRGPWGRDLTQRFAYAPGLEIRFEPELRRLIDGQLEPCKVSVVRDGILLQQSELQPKEITAAIDYDGNTIQVSPPAVAVTKRKAGVPTPWGNRAIEVTDIEARDGVNVIVRWPGRRFAQLNLVAVEGDQVSYQTLSPTGATQEGIFEFDLGQAQATIATSPHLRLVVSSGQEQMAIGKVVPENLIRRVYIKDEQIELIDRVQLKLIAYIWSMDHPWVEPHKIVFDLDTDSAELPERFSTSRHLVVAVVIHSLLRELGSIPSDVPELRLFLRKSDDGKVTSKTTILEDFELGEPPTSREFWRGIRFIADLWGANKASARQAVLFKIVTSKFESQASRLDELLAMGFSENEVLEFMLLTRIADQRPSLPSGMSESGPLLTAINLDIEGDDQELANRLFELIETLGTGAEEILRNASLTKPGMNLVNDQSVAFIKMPAAVRSVVLGHLAYVPQRPLDELSRSGSVQTTASWMADAYEAKEKSVTARGGYSAAKAALADLPDFEALAKCVEVSGDEIRSATAGYLSHMDVTRITDLLHLPQFIRAGLLYLRAVAWALIPVSPSHSLIESIFSDLWQDAKDLCYHEFLIAELMCIHKKLVERNFALPTIDESDTNDAGN